jgi:hypothetical protein
MVQTVVSELATVRAEKEAIIAQHKKERRTLEAEERNMRVRGNAWYINKPVVYYQTCGVLSNLWCINKPVVY